ncbi:hypothetical protein [Halobacillus litoralis]|uniref:Uncharacterized protein n=1 Tax=Halobacillus litoralis TaxID=45668 RepID=A0A410ME26_9BACI|nr:hypothetical protein [Halobacillus litoralis]QAS52915.1 hypothetical protein HLI_12275 [Halobacillus litoralis]
MNKPLEVASIAKIQGSQQVKKRPSVYDEGFAEMFDKDRFVDGIPLDELGRHLRRTKKYGKLNRRQK